MRLRLSFEFLMHFDLFDPSRFDLYVGDTESIERWQLIFNSIHFDSIANPISCVWGRTSIQCEHFCHVFTPYCYAQTFRICWYLIFNTDFFHSILHNQNVTQVQRSRHVRRKRIFSFFFGFERRQNIKSIKIEHSIICCVREPKKHTFRLIPISEQQKKDPKSLIVYEINSSQTHSPIHLFIWSTWQTFVWNGIVFSSVKWMKKNRSQNALLSLNQSKAGRERERERESNNFIYFQNSVFDKLYIYYTSALRCLHKMNIKMDFS